MAYYFVVLINLPNDTYLVSLLGLPLNLPFNLQQECQFWNSHLGIERYVLVALKMTRVCFCTSAKARGPCQKSYYSSLYFLRQSIYWSKHHLSKLAKQKTAGKLLSLLPSAGTTGVPFHAWPCTWIPTEPTLQPWTLVCHQSHIYSSRHEVQ